MARTEHLPIYKSAYDLCLHLEQVVHNFSRYHKYALGADLRDGARSALKLVVRANARRNKAPVLLDLREELEELKVFLRLAQDVKAFANFNSFQHAITLVVEIAKQNEGWLKSQGQGPGRNRPAMPPRLAEPSVPCSPGPSPACGTGCRQRVESLSRGVGTRTSSSAAAGPVIRVCGPAAAPARRNKRRGQTRRPTTGRPRPTRTTQATRGT